MGVPPQGDIALLTLLASQASYRDDESYNFARLN
jgi:hypothetical protein